MVRTFFENYCTHCHGEEKQKAKLTLHDIGPPSAADDRVETWRMIAEQLQFGDMPPEKAKQPSAQKRAEILATIKAALALLGEPTADSNRKLRLPEFGNHVDHAALFDDPPGPVQPAPVALWRLRSETYSELVRRFTVELADFPQPFPANGASSIRDFSALAVVDEPAVDLLYRNAGMVIANQQAHPRFDAIFQALSAEEVPSESLMRDALRLEFRLALRREPSRAETDRFVSLWRKNLATSGHPIGSRTALMAVLMLPETLFRYELGTGERDQHGRVRLAQRELAVAVSLALRDKIDPEILTAAVRGELATRAQVARHVARLLGAPLRENPRVLQFFREYFAYGNALGVFKDPPRRGRHRPDLLVADLERLILHILEEDRQVLRRLLTTNRAFVNWKDDGMGGGTPATTEVGYETVYGLPPDWMWTREQPVAMPNGQRAGVLTHPAWLVARSGNFDNDPVRRGKWIRTHLLGGTVPNVPIGADAKVPEDENRTLRERLASVTSKAECWRCHRKMDSLGLPFEQFTHFGRFRLRELEKPVDASGRIDRTGDSELDGRAVADPFQLIETLASSEHVEQVFVRHVFRFYLGRNETTGDAATLQAAWRAYRKSDGSFGTLVASILTSDSFLLRMP